MRIPYPAAAVFGALLVSCGSEPKPARAEPAAQAAAPKPLDESRRFPLTDLVHTELAEKQLMGKPFMPGGTLAHYKKGKKEYSMFVARLPSPSDAAFLLLNWNKTLTGSHLVPSFGGYFGHDGGQPVFVFSKGNWIAGVAGLPEKEADAAARTLAAHLN